MQAGTYTVNHTLQTSAPSVSDYANDPGSLAASLKAQQYNSKAIIDALQDNDSVDVDPAKGALYKALLASVCLNAHFA